MQRHRFFFDTALAGSEFRRDERLRFLDLGRGPVGGPDPTDPDSCHDQRRCDERNAAELLPELVACLLTCVRVLNEKLPGDLSADVAIQDARAVLSEARKRGLL